MSGIEKDYEAREWQRNRLCNKMLNPDIFFSEDERGIAMARMICNSCPVTVECLADALKQPPVEGAIVAGLTADEMAGLRRNAA